MADWDHRMWLNEGISRRAAEMVHGKLLNREAVADACFQAWCSIDNPAQMYELSGPGGEWLGYVSRFPRES